MSALRFQLATQVRTFPWQADLSLWAVSLPLHTGNEASTRIGEGEESGVRVVYRRTGTFGNWQSVEGEVIDSVRLGQKKVRTAFGVHSELSRRRGLLRGGQGAARVISFDEMWTYVGSRRKGKRNSVWTWTAVVEEVDGSRWVDFEVGARSEDTFLRLYERLPEAERYRTDAYKVYEWLPHNRHEVGKGSEVNRNEGLHSVLRGKLNRLTRKTKGYSKSVQMLRDSVALVCLRIG